ncbi:hypothetical protein AVEN_195143-1 [Araneus ventricosus]|uniref:Uncharacterized protein n=1 Tax=Araneus ventricosus TaxID=182803 RepID=A0A4Y2BGB5_ARAVE|nr:hypothetical protein AVEN_195143-1 [Araneus ventricosus]
MSLKETHHGKQMIFKECIGREFKDGKRLFYQKQPNREIEDSDISSALYEQRNILRQPVATTMCACQEACPYHRIQDGLLPPCTSLRFFFMWRKEGNA